jgi:hypothetical protein
MKVDEKTHEAIQRYLTQQMSPSEIAQFEQEMKDAPDIANEVREWREFRVVAKHSTLLERATLFDTWSKNIDGSEPLNEYDKLFESKSAAPSLWKKWLLGSFSLVLLAGGAYLGHKWWQNKVFLQQSISISKVYTKPLVNFVVFAAGSDTSLKPMLRHYDAGEYAKAVQLFESKAILKADKTAQLYAGVSCLLNEQPKKAFLLLQPLTTHSFFYANEALFYWGLAGLQLGKRTEVRQQWMQFPENSHFKTKIDDILKQL